MHIGPPESIYLSIAISVQRLPINAPSSISQGPCRGLQIAGNKNWKEAIGHCRVDLADFLEGRATGTVPDRLSVSLSIPN